MKLVHLKDFYKLLKYFEVNVGRLNKLLRDK